MTEDLGWVPGEPLYTHPRDLPEALYRDAQYVRPFFELMSDEQAALRYFRAEYDPWMATTWHRARCQVCLVHWNFEVDGFNCWSCGKETCDKDDILAAIAEKARYDEEEAVPF